MGSNSDFTSDLPKLQTTNGTKKSIDVASGREYATVLIKMLNDTATAYDVYTPIRRYADHIVGYDIYKLAKSLTWLKKLGVAEGLEHLIHTGRDLDSLTGLFEVAGHIDRQPLAEVVETAELKETRYISTSEPGAVGDEFFVVGYPVSETPVRDLEDTYLRALKQLSTLRHGRYAYAQDWNVLADYAKAIINVLVDQFKKLYAKMDWKYIDLYDMVLQCQRILSTYKYLRSGDVIMPEHTNTLIDVVWCLDWVTRLLFARMVARRREKDTTTGLEQMICSRGEIDVARSLDLTSRLREVDCEIVLVNTDDWATARKYVTDGTIIFVNYGTKAMSPSEVRAIVNTMKVVFAILIDTQPKYYVDVGAFYDVFYIVRRPTGIYCAYKCFYIYDYIFGRQCGLYGCTGGICGVDRYVWSLDDCSVSPYEKVDFAVQWSFWGYPWLYYSYAKYGAGAIIELPYDGTWGSVDDLNKLIAKIAHTLFDEVRSCQILVDGNKLRRIVWMASYSRGIEGYHRCPSTDQCLRGLASRTGCRFIDLRTS